MRRAIKTKKQSFFKFQLYWLFAIVTTIVSGNFSQVKTKVNSYLELNY
ncbi:MAG: hypothetical protein JWQ66_164 [Mucilaginibacter sp.]|nr:hypothetical protein [Mucilaginibacter sp.]